MLELSRCGAVRIFQRRLLTFCGFRARQSLSLWRRANSKAPRRTFRRFRACRIALAVAPCEFSTSPANLLRVCCVSKHTHGCAVRTINVVGEPSAGFVRVETLSLWRGASFQRLRGSCVSKRSPCGALQILNVDCEPSCHFRRVPALARGAPRRLPPPHRQHSTYTPQHLHCSHTPRHLHRTTCYYTWDCEILEVHMGIRAIGSYHLGMCLYGDLSVGFGIPRNAAFSGALTYSRICTPIWHCVSGPGAGEVTNESNSWQTKTVQQEARIQKNPLQSSVTFHFWSSMSLYAYPRSALNRKP